MGKGETAGYQHFLLFPQCFPKGSSAGSLKVVIVWERKVNAAGFVDRSERQSIGECMLRSACMDVQADVALHALKNKSTVRLRHTYQNFERSTTSDRLNPL